MQYLTIILPVVIAFAAGAVLGPVVIPRLRRLKLSQTERAEGVQSHLKKAGTPTMGGIMIIIALVAGSVFFAGKCPAVLPVLFLTVGFGAIGFIDDYIKVVKKRSDGLYPKQKLALQFIVTTVFLLILVFATDTGLGIMLPFTGGKIVSWGWFAIPFLYIVVLATVNGVNFTDGLDGLASSVTAVVAVFFIAASLLKTAGLEPVTAAVLGALLAFLLYNKHPAKIFMGDTGSLALGGFVAGMAYMMNMPLFILLFGLIYAVELVSVVLQVLYFKKTHGKRLFRMTPIHHHFELCGWSEPKVVGVFTLVTAAMCVVAFIAM